MVPKKFQNGVDYHYSSLPSSQVQLSSKILDSCTEAINKVSLHSEKFGDIAKDGQSAPLKKIIIAHGMLGSASNWSSIAKRLHRKTGRNIITFDVP